MRRYDVWILGKSRERGGRNVNRERTLFLWILLLLGRIIRYLIRRGKIVWLKEERYFNAICPFSFKKAG